MTIDIRANFSTKNEKKVVIETEVLLKEENIIPSCNEGAST